MWLTRRVAALLVAAAATACSGQKTAAPPAATGTPAASTEADTPIPQTASPYSALPEGVRAILDKPFTGDFDEMVKRRMIRVGVTFNRTHYFIDKGQPRRAIRSRRWTRTSRAPRARLA